MKGEQGGRGRAREGGLCTHRSRSESVGGAPEGGGSTSGLHLPGMVLS